MKHEFLAQMNTAIAESRYSDMKKILNDYAKSIGVGPMKGQSWREFYRLVSECGFTLGLGE
jgi:hypothetical protein